MTTGENFGRDILKVIFATRRLTYFCSSLFLVWKAVECLPYLSRQVVSDLTSLEQSANMTKSELSLTISNTKIEVKWSSALFWTGKDIVGKSLVTKDKKGGFRIICRIESFLKERYITKTNKNKTKRREILEELQSWPISSHQWEC